MKLKHFVGLDVHCQFTQIAVVDESGRLIRQQVCPTTIPALVRVARVTRDLRLFFFAKDENSQATVYGPTGRHAQAGRPFLFAAIPPSQISNLIRRMPKTATNFRFSWLRKMHRCRELRERTGSSWVDACNRAG